MVRAHPVGKYFFRVFTVVAALELDLLQHHHKHDEFGKAELRTSVQVLM